MINSESLLAYGKYTHIAIQMKNRHIKYDFLFQATRMTLSFILLYKCSRMWNVEMGDATEGQSAIGDREKREKKNHCHRRFGSLRSKCDGRCLMMTPFFSSWIIIIVCRFSCLFYCLIGYAFDVRTLGRICMYRIAWRLIEWNGLNARAIQFYFVDVIENWVGKNESASII